MSTATLTRSDTICGGCHVEFATMALVFSHDCPASTPVRPGPNGNRHDSIDAPEGGGTGSGRSEDTTAPSEKQVRFLTALVRGNVATTPEWADGRLNADDAEAIVEATVALVATSRRKASDAIDKLVAKGTRPTWDALVTRTAPAAPTGRTNRYASPCAACGQQVPAEAGSLTRNAANIWQVHHIGPCPTPVAPAAPAAPTDGYVPVEDDVHVVDGDYYRVHISQTSGRPYAAVWNGSKFVGPRYDDRAKGALAKLNRSTLATAEQAAAFGHANKSCCFCSRKIDTPESKAVGYGPVCAAKRDLPWGGEA